MKINFRNFIQVAGVIDKNEALLLQDCGVKFLGFPLRLPVNKEDLTEESAAEIINSFEPPSYGILITYLSKAGEIIGLCRKLGAIVVQLHGDIAFQELINLKDKFPDLKVIKSLVVGSRNYDQLEGDVIMMEDFVDAFITDTYDETTGASGATGKTHDWQISKKLVELSPKPVILAGGLTPDNVYEAIITVKPSGVDSHTGLENQMGRKDAGLVKRFVDEAKRGFKDAVL